MKKILEVLQYGDIDIRFNTDLDPVKNPNIVPDVISRTAFAMVTKLWGGTELAVLAMIRALAVADLAVSVNRKQMLRLLDEQSALMAKTFRDSLKDMESRGVKVMTFAPGITPSTIKC